MSVYYQSILPDQVHFQNLGHLQKSEREITNQSLIDWFEDSIKCYNNTLPYEIRYSILISELTYLWNPQIIAPPMRSSPTTTNIIPMYLTKVVIYYYR